ncbi:MAG: DUF5615 family PIN-like protein [Planctomycetes bacterium]|nr:DUF5615 family PIN-like protein [Planctomycetota bacterium]
MARLYADEDFDLDVVIELRALGHDVLTVQEAGNAGNSDLQVLADAIAMSRAVLTFNRRHFRKLARSTTSHYGIIDCTRDNDVAALSHRIHNAIASVESLANLYIRIVRPNQP